MTPRKPPQKLRRHPHGLYALQGALRRVEEGQDWTEALGPVGVALRAWRGDLLETLGGEDTVSPQRRALVELATRTHLMVESVDRYILGMPCLVNKSRRQLFAVVRERQQLADSLTRQLAQIGLERQAKDARSYAERLMDWTPTEPAAAPTEPLGVRSQSPRPWSRRTRRVPSQTALGTRRPARVGGPRCPRSEMSRRRP